MYTVTIQTAITEGEVISRFFETKKAAQKWFKWLTSKPMTIRTSIYSGGAGADLLDRFVREMA